MRVVGIWALLGRCVAHRAVRKKSLQIWLSNNEGDKDCRGLECSFPGIPIQAWFYLQRFSCPTGD